MKKILLYILSVLVMALTACYSDPVQTEDIPEGMERFTFGLNIPDAESLTRAAWVANESGNLLIKDMYVLVFDQYGFLSRHKATLNEPSKASFSVTLPVSTEPRVLHFVCNWDGWDTFSDENSRLLNEAGVLANMQVSGNEIAYWRRLEMNSGISSTAMPATVTLIRNVAKISVINNSKAVALADDNDDVESYLENVEYTLGNYYGNGTVALFDTVTGQFSDGSGNVMQEATGPVLMPAVENYLPAYVASESDTNGRSFFTYERRKSPLGDPGRLFIIVKADYYPNESTAPQERYYKIDISRPVPDGEYDEDDLLYDIRRNHHYVITIGKAIHIGYDSFPEAIDPKNLSLNNFATAIEQAYNSVSDGKAVLNIEYVNRTFVKEGSAFNIRYSYIPDTRTNATDNVGVQASVKHTSNQAVDLPEGPLALPNQKIAIWGWEMYNGESVYLPRDNPALGQYVDRVSGTMMGTIPALPTVAQSSIRISKLGLSRTIVLKLRQPYQFENPAINGNSSSATVGTGSGIAVNITFGIPAEMEEFLPFDVYLEGAKMLMPNEGSNVYFEDLGTSFRYKYKVTTTGAKTLRMLTGATASSGASATLTLSSELIGDKTFTLIR